MLVKFVHLDLIDKLKVDPFEYTINKKEFKLDISILFPLLYVYY